MKGSTPNKLRAHLVRYATNSKGGEFWTWLLTVDRNGVIARGPLGFRFASEAREHVKLMVATIATGKLVRQMPTSHA